MGIREFRISRRAADHILEKHGVTLEEVLEAAESSPVYRRARGDALEQRRYMIAGRTGTGRRLWIVFADEGAGMGRIITAREARGHADRARHRRMRGD
jgi:uncharacterized DUF497 family protein